MDNLERDEENVEESGLEIATSSVRVGSTYPIFGMITKFLQETPGELICELNSRIVAKVFVSDPERISILKRKAFETGIFLSTVVAVEPMLKVECKAVIFGKDQAHTV